MMNQRIEGTESWTNYWICVYRISLNKNDILSNLKLILMAIVLLDLELDNETNKLTEWLDLMKILKQIVPPTYQ